MESSPLAPSFIARLRELAQHARNKNLKLDVPFNQQTHDERVEFLTALIHSYIDENNGGPAARNQFRDELKTSLNQILQNLSNSNGNFSADVLKAIQELMKAKKVQFSHNGADEQIQVF